MGKKVFLAWLDEDNQKREGYVELLEQEQTYIKFRTNSNIITISYNRLLKLKEGKQ